MKSVSEYCVYLQLLHIPSTHGEMQNSKTFPSRFLNVAFSVSFLMRTKFRVFPMISSCDGLRRKNVPCSAKARASFTHLSTLPVAWTMASRVSLLSFRCARMYTASRLLHSCRRCFCVTMSSRARHCMLRMPNKASDVLIEMHW